MLAANEARVRERASVYAGTCVHRREVVLPERVCQTTGTPLYTPSRITACPVFFFLLLCFCFTSGSSIIHTQGDTQLCHKVNGYDRSFDATVAAMAVEMETLGGHLSMSGSASFPAGVDRSARLSIVPGAGR